jgi:hypothetical protein
MDKIFITSLRSEINRATEEYPIESRSEKSITSVQESGSANKRYEEVVEQEMEYSDFVDSVKD